MLSPFSFSSIKWGEWYNDIASFVFGKISSSSSAKGAKSSGKWNHRFPLYLIRWGWIIINKVRYWVQRWIKKSAGVSLLLIVLDNTHTGLLYHGMRTERGRELYRWNLYLIFASNRNPKYYIWGFVITLFLEFIRFKFRISRDCVIKGYTVKKDFFIER